MRTRGKRKGTIFNYDWSKFASLQQNSREGENESKDDAENFQ